MSTLRSLKNWLIVFHHARSGKQRLQNGEKVESSKCGKTPGFLAHVLSNWISFLLTSVWICRMLTGARRVKHVGQGRVTHGLWADISLSLPGCPTGLWKSSTLTATSGLKALWVSSRGNALETRPEVQTWLIYPFVQKTRNRFLCPFLRGLFFIDRHSVSRTRASLRFSDASFLKETKPWSGRCFIF